MKKALSILTAIALIIGIQAAALPAGLFSVTAAAQTPSLTREGVTAENPAKWTPSDGLSYSEEYGWGLKNSSYVKKNQSVSFLADFGTEGINYMTVNAAEPNHYWQCSVQVTPYGGSKTYYEGLVCGFPSGHGGYSDPRPGYMRFERTYYGLCIVKLINENGYGNLHSVGFDKKTGLMQTGVLYTAPAENDWRVRSSAFSDNGYTNLNEDSAFYMDVDFGDGANCIDVSVGWYVANSKWEYTVYVDGQKVTAVSATNLDTATGWLGKTYTGIHTVTLLPTLQYTQDGTPFGANLNSVKIDNRECYTDYGEIPASHDAWFMTGTDPNGPKYEADSNGDYHFGSFDGIDGEKAVSLAINFANAVDALKIWGCQPNGGTVTVYADGNPEPIGQVVVQAPYDKKPESPVYMPLTTALQGRHLLTFKTDAVNLYSVAGHSHSTNLCTEGGTCTEYGCGFTVAEPSHRYSEATCDHPATCGSCQAISGTVTPHTYTDTATCGKQNACTACGSAVVEPVAHDTAMVYNAVTGTCLQEGYTAGVACSVCGEAAEAITLAGKDPTKHVGYEVKVGTREQCSKYNVCGCTYKEHSFIHQSVNDDYLKTAATCTQPAVYYYRCIACAVTSDKTYEYGEPLGHAWEGTVCSVCTAHNPADTNRDGLLSSRDAVYLLYHTLLPTQYPVEQGDFDGNGIVDVEDAVCLLYDIMLLDLK